MKLYACVMSQLSGFYLLRCTLGTLGPLCCWKNAPDKRAALFQLITHLTRLLQLQACGSSAHIVPRLLHAAGVMADTDASDELMGGRHCGAHGRLCNYTTRRGYLRDSSEAIILEKKVFLQGVS